MGSRGARPAGVHAQQHFCEVGGVHSPGPGADGDHRFALVVLAVQQGADLELTEGLAHRGEFGAGVLHEGVGIVAGFFLPELDERLEIRDPLPHLLHALEIGLGVGEAGVQLLGGLGSSQRPGSAACSESSATVAFSASGSVTARIDS